ncbi:putative methyltransferase NSUN7 [Hippoglossus stenolepis]|uniref:putative methyltransferase NSUN7 n=1 Tax=Hippoglossus stenolepis TaxID=195615 RepID=UPI001FAF1785|nr:putative methyltransferase NSUN7 [Hippoglossus stenolepis]
MSSVLPSRRIVNDKVGSSEDVMSSSVTEQISHQDPDKQTNKETLSFLLPLPHLQSSLPSPVSPPSDQAYLQAAVIFQQLREEKPGPLQPLRYGKQTDTPLPEGGDKPTQRRAYQLAFNTLKYQDLLEDIITDSCFHTSQQISADLLPLAMVMLFDFQDRKFMLREQTAKELEEPLQEVRELERSLYKRKTKLAASLARCRVKLNLQSISCFLSDPVRTKQHRAKRLPLFAWVNTLKTSVEEVCEALHVAGLCEAEDLTDLKDLAFCRDSLCPDTLVFSRQLLARLQHSSLTAAHVLNIQDRSVCVAVSVLRPLLFDNGDVLVVGSFSAVTVAHVAVVASARSGRVLVCGADHTSSQVEEIQGLLGDMDIKNVRILSEAFCGLNEWDAAVQRLKVILVLPQCSSSALNDPVPTMHSEHGNWDLLSDLSHGSVARSKIHVMAAQQARLLAHTLTFPKVQTVVYCSRSVYPEENEQLVKRVLDKTHTHPKLLPFRVNGPIFPVDSESEDATVSKFFRLEPSQVTNGCFAARLSRQADPTKVETVQDVLARAAAKGLLGGILPDQLKMGKKGKSRKNREAGSERGPPEEEKGEGEVKGNEEEEEGKREEDGGKRRGVKGRKRKLKQGQKQSKAPADAKQQTKSQKKKPTKKKGNQSHPTKRPSKSKQRRIPRLTLTLMSSEKTSNQLSPITALAHRLSETPVIGSQRTVSSAPSSAGKHPSPAPTAPSTPPAASRQLQGHNTQPERQEKTLRDGDKSVSPLKARGKVVGPQEVRRAARGSVLPPIPSPSSGSLRSRAGSSPSHTSHSHHKNMSTSSSSVSLPGL